MLSASQKDFFEEFQNIWYIRPEDPFEIPQRFIYGISPGISSGIPNGVPSGFCIEILHEILPGII